MADTTKATGKSSPKESLALVKEIIKIARMKNNMTQSELTECSKVLQTAVGRVERSGLIQTDGLFLLLKTLNLLDPMQDLLKEMLREVKAMPDPETPTVSWSKGIQRAR